MLLILLFACTAAALRLHGFQPTAISSQFTISRIPKARSRPVSQSSELKITSNVVNLQRKEATSLSSIYVQAMRGKRGVSRVTNGTTPLISVEGGQVFLADVTIGGRPYQVVVDTGSSDPWLAQTGFQCYDPFDDTLQDTSACEFGPTYDALQSTTYSALAGQNFNVSYADGEYLNGGLGFETFTMAGITVPQQQFGVVNFAAWYGDGISSGLIGFAYRTLTSAYGGTDPIADVRGRPIFYNPLFVNMYEQQGVPAIFSLALDRNASAGGILALGGIPDVQHSPYFASTPIQGVRVNATSGEQVYEFYTINIDGYAYAANRSARFDPYNHGSALRTPLAYNGSESIVDSGTSLLYVPDEVAEDTAALFDPPAYYDSSQGAYFVSCAAKAPVFGVGVGKKIFYVNPEDLIIEVQRNVCVMGVQSDGGGLSILGGTWLKNVVAVFDIEGEQMRFAARQFYDLY